MFPLIALIAAGVVSITVALLALPALRSWPAVVAASGSAGLVAFQLASTILLRHPMHFPHGRTHGQAVLEWYVAGAVLGSIALTIAISVRAILERWTAGASAVAKDSPAAGDPDVAERIRENHRRRKVEAALAEEAAACGTAETIALVVALLALAGPSLTVGAYGSAPLATVDAVGCGLVGSAMIGWLSASGNASSWICLALASLACCVTILPLVSPRSMEGQPVTLLGAWPLALACLGLLVATIIVQIGRLRSRDAAGGHLVHVFVPMALPIVACLLLR